MGKEAKSGQDERGTLIKIRVTEKLYFTDTDNISEHVSLEANLGSGIIYLKYLAGVDMDLFELSTRTATFLCKTLQKALQDIEDYKELRKEPGNGER